MDDALNIESFNATVHEEQTDELMAVLHQLTTVERPEDVNLLKGEIPAWGWNGWG